MLYAVYQLTSTLHFKVDGLGEKIIFILNRLLLFYKSADYYNINSTLQPTSRFTQKTYSAYFEYGISNRLVINGYIPVLKQNAYENTVQKNGISDIKLELKYAVQKGKFPSSINFCA